MTKHKYKTSRRRKRLFKKGLLQSLTKEKVWASVYDSIIISVNKLLSMSFGVGIHTKRRVAKWQ